MSKIKATAEAATAKVTKNPTVPGLKYVSALVGIGVGVAFSKPSKNSMSLVSPTDYPYLVTESQDLLAKRYGKKTPDAKAKKRRSAFALGGVLVFTALVAAFSLATYNPLSYKDLSYKIESELSVWVEFEVSAPLGVAVRCDIQALNNQFAVVGFKSVSLPASQEPVNTYSIRLNTTELAVTGLVDKCELD